MNERRLTEQLQRLSAFSFRVNSEQDVRVILGFVVDQARELLDAHHAAASFALDDEWMQVIKRTSSLEQHKENDKDGSFLAGKELAGTVCHKNIPLRLNRTEPITDEKWIADRLPDHTLTQMNQPPGQSWLGVPFIGRDGRNLGLIELADKQDGDFTSEDEAMLMNLAQIAAVSIENLLHTQYLRSEKDRLHFALASSRVIGTWDWDIKDNRVVTDARFASLYGADPEKAAVGAPVAHFLSNFHPDDLSQVKAAIIKALRTGEDYLQEFRLLQKDGSVRWVQSSGRAYLNRAGRAVRFSGISFDITAERIATDALRLSEHRFRFLSELEEATRGLQDPGQIMQISTQKMVEYLRVSRCAYADVEPDGDHFTIRHDSVAEGITSTVGYYSLALFGSKAVKNLYAGRTLIIRDIQAELPFEDGAMMFKAIGIQAIITCPLVKEGRLHAMMAVHQNETRNWTSDEIRLMETVAERSWAHIERVRDELKLHESEKQFRQLADLMPQIVWTARPDGYVDYYNARWYEFTGFTFQQGGDESWLSIFHPDDVQPTYERWYQSIATGEPYEMQFRYRDYRRGEYRWYLGRALPVRDEVGTIIKWFGTSTDIQEQKQAIEAMSEARNAAEAANLAKTEFLANMSHEIRTPMNAIVGLSHILSMSVPLTEKQQEFIRTLQLSADALLNLINDLLDIVKIEAGTIELETIPFSLAEIIQDVISMMEVRVREKGLTLTAEGPCIESRMFLGDPTRLRQIIMNLCSNAVKFTSRGGVDIRVMCAPSGKQGVEDIFITIKDTGIGIPPEKQATIFDKFTQADISITRKYGGTGLGLAITKKLVETMEGTISVHSTPGEGAAFTVCLPLQRSDDMPDSAHPSSLAALSIPAHSKHAVLPHLLLVEDHEPNVLVAKTFLEKFGYSCDVARTGLEAVDKVKHNPYALVLMDVRMQGMNGLEATRQIRAYEQQEQASRLPIIGMTAHAMAGDRERCMEAGMDDYIPKPFNPDELHTKIESMRR